MSGVVTGPFPHFDAPPDIEFARPFWDAVQRSELHLPRCSVCGRWQWYPDLAGPDCVGATYEWVPVSTTGTVHTCTRVHRPFLPGGTNDVPYVVGFVELDGVEGLRLVVNLVDDTATVQIGARVAAQFVDLGTRRHLVFAANVVTMRTLPLGSDGPDVGALGLGCMVLTGMYGPADPNESIATFHAALDAGVTLLDTADSYSNGENERFLGPLVAPVRDRVVLSSKFGLVTGAPPGARVDACPERVRACCEASLARLGTDHLDLYYLHRVDPRYPVEETVGEMAALVDAGLVRHLGLCEVFPDELRRAHAVHPIAALQSEWSLWARAMEPCMLVARELGVTLVPYGPLGRGFLTGAISATTALAADDRRIGDPRFSEAHRAANLALVEQVRVLATAKGVRPAQVALAWLWAQGDDVVPIPGLERREYLADAIGALDVRLTDDELTQLDAWFAGSAVAGTGDETHLRRITPP